MMQRTIEAVVATYLELEYETRKGRAGEDVFTLYMRKGELRAEDGYMGSERPIVLTDVLVPVAQDIRFGLDLGGGTNCSMHNTLRSLRYNFPALRDGFTYHARPMSAKDEPKSFQGEVREGENKGTTLTTVHEVK